MHTGGHFRRQKGLVRGFSVDLDVANSFSGGPIWPIFFCGTPVYTGGHFRRQKGLVRGSQWGKIAILMGGAI